MCDLEKAKLGYKFGAAASISILFGMVVTLGVPCVCAQSKKVQPEVSVVSYLNPDHLMRSVSPPLKGTDEYAPDISALRTHALMGAPRINFASDIRTAKLPPTSGRNFAPISVPSNSLLHNATPRPPFAQKQSEFYGLDTEKLFDGGRTNPDDVR